MFHSRRGQAYFSACLLWMQSLRITPQTSTNIDLCCQLCNNLVTTGLYHSCRTILWLTMVQIWKCPRFAPHIDGYMSGSRDIKQRIEIWTVIKLSYCTQLFNCLIPNQQLRLDNLHHYKLMTQRPPLAKWFAYDTYAMAFDFYQQIHRTRTFSQKFQQADSLGTVCRPLDQQISHFPTFW